MSKIPLALVGVGKIALDQHAPALAASPDFELAATVSRKGRVEGVPGWTDLARMLAERPDVRVLSFCTPPGPRFEGAAAALRAGRHVMLEKPPGATLAEVHALEAMAAQQGLTLFASWHSRMAQAVGAAKAWLADKRVLKGRIIWREDARKWHPGQDWIFEPGGMGVFDPGINALSILTEILPAPLRLTAAELDYPANRQTPIAARLAFAGDVSADFDFRQEGLQTWDVEIETDGGRLALRMGGNKLEIDGAQVEGDHSIAGEYPALYARLADLLRRRASDVDLRPMVLVSDALTLGRRNLVESFEWERP